MTAKKENERSRVIRVLLAIAESGNRYFTIESLGNAYNATYFLKPEYEEKVASAGGAVAAAGTYWIGDYYFEDGYKKNVHFHYYVKKLLAEGLIEYEGRSHYKGRAKRYTINFTARSVAKLKLSERKGKSLKKRVRRKPLNVEFRLTKVVRDENGSFVRDEDGNTVYETVTVTPEELAPEVLFHRDENYNPTSPLRGNTVDVYAAEVGEELAKVARLHLPYWSDERPYRLTGTADNGRNFERFYTTAENLIKAVKYRKLERQFKR